MESASPTHNGTATESTAAIEGRALELVNQVTDQLVGSLDLDEVLETLIAESTRFVGAQRGSFLLHHRKSNVLKIGASRGIPAEVIPEVKIDPGEGLAGGVFSRGEPLFLRNLDHQPGGEEKETREYSNNSAILIPLKMHGTVLGVLNLTNKIGGRKT